MKLLLSLLLACTVRCVRPFTRHYITCIVPASVYSQLVCLNAAEFPREKVEKKGKGHHPVLYCVEFFRFSLFFVFLFLFVVPGNAFPENKPPYLVPAAYERERERERV